MINVSTMKPRQKVKGKAWPLFALILILFLGFCLFTPLRVSGHSMNPTLRDGQLLFLQRLLPNFSYQRNDIVVLNPPRELLYRASRYVKRVIAVSGDTLSMRDDVVYLNDQMVREPYVTQHSSFPENFPEVIVSEGEIVAFEGFALAELPEYLKDTLAMLEPLPKAVLEQSQNETITYVGGIKLKENFYFVLGDNRGFSASEDSRFFGAVSQKDLLGKVKTLGVKEVEE
jgi:signal peptidase I